MQTIYVFWRFTFQEAEKEVKNSNNKIIKFVKYPHDNIDEAKKVFDKYSTIEVNSAMNLLLVHDKPGNEDLLKGWFNKYKDTVEIFGGGSGMIYSVLDLESKEDFRINKYTDDDFNKVWDEYSIKKKLERLKKRIINLWLPLAIDVQGLSEIKEDKTKSEKYYKEIKEELVVSIGNGSELFKQLTSFPQDSDIPIWNEIEKKLENGYKEFTPADLVKFILASNFIDFKEKSKNIKTNFLHIHKLNEKGEMILDEKKKPIPNPNFLPNWLQKVVSILDTEIENLGILKNNE